MARFPQFLTDVLHRALDDAEARAFPLFTIAFYHDHESRALSVCLDTEENSLRFLRETNRYNSERFMRAVRSGDLEEAALWEANLGRSLSLGDFVAVNLARTELGEMQLEPQFHLCMVRALVACHDRVRDLAPDPEKVVLVCSGPDDEVQFAWALPQGGATR